MIDLNGDLPGSLPGLAPDSLPRLAAGRFSRGAQSISTKKKAPSLVGVAEALTVKEVITLKKQVRDGHFLLSFLC
jgi:hypothetical protein